MAAMAPMAVSQPRLRSMKDAFRVISRNVSRCEDEKRAPRRLRKWGKVMKSDDVPRKMWIYNDLYTYYIYIYMWIYNQPF